MGTSATLSSRITASVNHIEMFRVNAAVSIEESARGEEEPIEKFCYMCEKTVTEKQNLFFWQIRCGECKNVNTCSSRQREVNAKRLRDYVQKIELDHQKTSSNISAKGSLEKKSSWRGSILQCLKKVSDTKVSPTSTLPEEDDLSTVSRGNTETLCNPIETRSLEFQETVKTGEFIVDMPGRGGPFRFTPTELMSTSYSSLRDSSPSVAPSDIPRGLKKPLGNCNTNTSKPNTSKISFNPNPHLLESEEKSKSRIVKSFPNQTPKSKRLKSTEMQPLNTLGCVIRYRTSSDKDDVSTASIGETETKGSLLETQSLESQETGKTEEFVANESGRGDARTVKSAKQINTPRSSLHNSSPSVSSFNIPRDFKRSIGNNNTNTPNTSKISSTPNSHLLENKEKIRTRKGTPSKKETPKRTNGLRSTKPQDLNAPGCVIRNRTSPDKDDLSTVSRGETETPYSLLETWSLESQKTVKTEEFIAYESGCEDTKMATSSAQLNSYSSPRDSPPSVSPFNISRDFKKSQGNDNTNTGKSSTSNTLSTSNSHLLESKDKSKFRKVKSSANQTPKRSKRRKRTATQDLKAPECVIRNFVRTPKDGHYIVVQQAIEECPLCYTELCPSTFTLNTEYFILTTVCTGCELTIYIIFQPPDGSPPKIFTMEGKKPVRQKKKKYFPPRKRNKVIIVYDDDLALSSSVMLWGM